MVKHCHLRKHSGHQTSEQADLGRDSSSRREPSMHCRGHTNKGTYDEDFNSVLHIGSRTRSKYGSDS